jgi:hypothetical protein
MQMGILHSAHNGPVTAMKWLFVVGFKNDRLCFLGGFNVFCLDLSSHCLIEVDAV